MDTLLTVVGISGVLLFLVVLFSVRRAHIRVEYSVSWLGAAIVLMVVSLNGELLNWLATFLGISYAPIALLFVISTVFLFVFYRFSIRLSDLKDANIALAQRVAILEYQLRSSHETTETPTNS
jgi:hypothetical protein